MIASFSAELLKLAKRPGVWVVSGVWLALSLVFEYLFPYLSYRGQSVGPPSGAGRQLLAQLLTSHFVTTAVAGWPYFGGALILVLGALVTGSEFSWGSLKTILAQGPRRHSVLAGKLLAVGVIVMLLGFAGFAASAGLSALIAAAESQAASWPSPGDVFRGIGVGWLVLVMWSMAGMFLGVLTRGTSLAIGLGVIWVLAVEQLVRGFAPLIGALDTLERWLPGTNAGGLVAAIGVAARSTAGVTAVVGGMHALLVVVAYIVGFSVLAGLLLSRRDVA